VGREGEALHDARPPAHLGGARRALGDAAAGGAQQLGHSDGGVLFLKVYGKFMPKKEERDRWEKMATARDEELAARRSASSSREVDRMTRCGSARIGASAARSPRVAAGCARSTCARIAVIAALAIAGRRVEAAHRSSSGRWRARGACAVDAACELPPREALVSRAGRCEGCDAARVRHDGQRGAGARRSPRCTCRPDGDAMKAAIESTDVITTVDGQPARVWKGTTEQGTPFLAFIARCTVEDPHDVTEFEDLQSKVPPRELHALDVLRAFSTRML
jgi:hypothetical protein